MINRVLRTITLALACAIIPKPVIAGPLNLEEGIEYLYNAAKERGVLATVWDWNGNKSAAVALKYAVLHNEAKTLHFAALMIGMDVTIEPKPVPRFLVTPSLNLIDCSRWLWERDRVRKHLTVNSGPKGWEFYAGPQIRPPQSKWTNWTWKTHTGWLVALSARVGGKPLESVE